MTTIKEKIAKILRKAAESEGAVEVSVPEGAAEKFGHYSTNVAMRLAKERGAKPMDLAEKIAEAALAHAPKGFFSRAEAAAPGFVNFWLSNEAVLAEFADIVSDKSFGTEKTRAGQTVLVEFTDPNPFKEFHIGHLMSNAIGESIARLTESRGADVKRLSYGGDVGLHVAKAIFGVLKKKDEIAALKKEDEKKQLAFWAEAYVAGSAAYEEDEAAKKEIDELNRIIFEKADPEIEKLYAWGRKVSVDAFQAMFARLDTKFVRNYWESEVVEEGMKTVEEGLAQGILEKSEGAVVFKGEQYGLHTRVFVNSKGVPTYEAKELGLTAKKKSDFHFDESIVITGNEQNDYFKVLMKAVDLLMPDLVGKTRHVSHGMLRFASGKMSSRKGNVITAEALLAQTKQQLTEKVSERSSLNEKERAEATEAIAIGAVRYSILKQNPGQDIIFDFEKSLSFEGDSGPYLQYAHARLRSIARKAEEELGISRPAFKKGAAELTSEYELALMRRIFEFPAVVAHAAERLAPSGLAAYLYKLAVAANKFYETTPILKDENSPRREARLALAETASRTLASGLYLLGMKALEKI